MGDELRNLRFICICDWKQGKTRQATMVAAQIHRVLETGDTTFGDDGFRRQGQVLLQSLSRGMLTTFEEFE